MMAVSTSRSRGLTRVSDIFPALWGGVNPLLPAANKPAKRFIFYQLPKKKRKFLLFNSRESREGCQQEGLATVLRMKL